MDLVVLKQKGQTSLDGLIKLVAVGCVIGLITFFAGIYSAVAIEQQQALPPTLYEWWSAFPDWKAKLEAAFWIFSPGIITVVGSIFINSSIRKVYRFPDKVMLPVAFGVSGVLGGVITLSLMDMINRSIGIQMYDDWSPVWAVPLSMIAVHVAFRMTCRVLQGLYLIGGKLPETSKWHWLGGPIQTLAKQIYFSMTGKSVYLHVQEPEEHGDITRMMGSEDPTDPRDEA